MENNISQNNFFFGFWFYNRLSPAWFLVKIGFKPVSTLETRPAYKPVFLFSYLLGLKIYGVL